VANFQSRLLEARKAGDLTVADLANWFDLPFSTVRYWTTVDNSDLAPRGPRGRVIHKRLQQLEWAIRNQVGFPVPPMLSARDRPSHMVRTRDAVDGRVPAEYLAG
jgi:hypothetical protein